MYDKNCDLGHGRSLGQGSAVSFSVLHNMMCVEFKNFNQRLSDIADSVDASASLCLPAMSSDLTAAVERWRKAVMLLTTWQLQAVDGNWKLIMNQSIVQQRTITVSSIISGLNFQCLMMMTGM